MDKISRMVLLVAVVALGLVIPGCSSNDVSTPTPQENLAPDFQLAGLDGQLVTLSDLRGKPVLLNFWTTRCGSCRFEMPFIQDIYEDEEFLSKGLVILAISIDEEPYEVKKYMVDNGLTFTVLLDTEQETAQKYNIRGIPSTFFINEDGIIKSVRIGAFSSSAEIKEGLEGGFVPPGGFSVEKCLNRPEKQLPLTAFIIEYPVHTVSNINTVDGTPYTYFDITPPGLNGDL